MLGVGHRVDRWLSEVGSVASDLLTIGTAHHALLLHRLFLASLARPRWHLYGFVAVLSLDVAVAEDFRVRARARCASVLRRSLIILLLLLLVFRSASEVRLERGSLGSRGFGHALPLILGCGARVSALVIAIGVLI